MLYFNEFCFRYETEVIIFNKLNLFCFDSRPGSLVKHFILPEIEIQKKGYATVWIIFFLIYRMNGKIQCIVKYI